MDVDAYLSRINHRGAVPPTAETLRALVRAHLLTVPFENLDIHLGVPIQLHVESLFDKIVRRRRGGFCFELNGLFAAFLRELGFRVALLNSRIPAAHNGWGGDLDHPILLVELKERCIVDVGFGDCYRTPLRLDEPGEQQGLHSRYRLEPDGADNWRFLELVDGAWDFFYEFTLEPVELSDFRLACDYYEGSPQSGFTKRVFCTRATPEGHTTLRGDQLTITRGEAKEEQVLTDDDQRAAALREHFAISFEGRLRAPHLAD